MIRMFALAGALVFTLAGASAGANAFGQFGGATPLPLNGHVAGGYLQVSEGTLGALGQLRLSFYPGLDFGFQGGLLRVDAGTSERTAIRVGGDFKAQIIRSSESTPLDASLGGALGIETSDGYTLLSLGPTGVASRSFPFSGSQSLSPYVGLALLFSRLDLGSSSSTDLAIPLRLGAEVKFGMGIQLVTEVQLQISNDFSDDVAFSVGLHSPF